MQVLMPTKIQIVETGICPDTFDDKDLPTDVHIITFTEDGERKFDAVQLTLKLTFLMNTMIS